MYVAKYCPNLYKVRNLFGFTDMIRAGYGNKKVAPLPGSDI